MTNILVASDLSARSDRALTRGFLLAKELGADLHVAHIVDETLPSDLKAHALAWARQTLARETGALASATGVQPAIVVCEGHRVAQIVNQAQRTHADLVVLGVHNPSGSARSRFSETTASRIASTVRCPVLLVTRDAAKPYADVVIGVDFSPFSRAGLQQSVRFVPRGRLHFVHAYHVPFKGLVQNGDFEREVEKGELRKLDAFLQDEMALLSDHAVRLGISASSLTRVLQEGAPAEVIAAECHRISADLVVVGTHGRTGVVRSIWGSVAAALLDNPPADVLVAKLPV